MTTLIIFANKYVQTRKVAVRIASVMTAAHHEVQVVDIATINPEFSLAPYDAVILGGPAGSSTHSSELGGFIKRNRATLDQKKTAYFAVHLSAAGRKNQPDDTIQCMDQFLTEVAWVPTATTIFAGGIPLPQPTWLTRMARKMNPERGGDTFASSNFEYTNWASVDGFAQDFIALPSGSSSQSWEGTTESSSQ